MSPRRVVDLSHPIDAAIPMFPGLPAPEIAEHLSREASRAHYAGGTEFVIHRYSLIGNSGTYLDAPFHRYADGADLATLPLERLVDLPSLVLDRAERVAAGQRAIDVADLDGLDLTGRALLIHTGWAARWGQEHYLDPNPYVTAAAAEVLVAAGVVLVGIDTWNIDDVEDRTRPVHSALLRAGIPIIENLRGLEHLPPSGFRFFAAPLPFRGGSAVPVRAYAVVDRE